MSDMENSGAHAGGPDIAALLLDWYDAEHRRLPWRISPGSAITPDPYRVWLSEIMLQQTTVAAVIAYFEAFTTRWPTVTALAAAEDGDVMAAWAGLGYYARARNLLACARIVVAEHVGRFPATEDDLRNLPGIGAYTAAAIAAIAFGRRAVVVDGNIERVVARLFAVESPIPGAKRRLRELADSLTPAIRAGDFAQAMMDLGSGICRPRAPGCPICPLRAECRAATLGIAATLPRRVPKKPRPLRYANAYVLRSAGKVMLVRRPPRGLLGGMLALPLGEIAAVPDTKGTLEGAPISASWTQVTSDVEHVFTHFTLRINVLCAVVDESERPDGIWVKDSRIARGLPTAFRKAAEAALAVPEIC